MSNTYSHVLIDRDVKERKGTIGGSQICGALGFPEAFDTQLEVHNQFTEGAVKEFTPEQLELMMVGTELEAAIARIIENKYGIKLKQAHKAYQNAEYPWLVVHPDRTVNRKLAVEIKATSTWAYRRADENGDKVWGEEDTDQMPLQYKCQCLGYFWTDVVDLDGVVWLVALVDNRPRRYMVTYDQPEVYDKLFIVLVNTVHGWQNGIVPKSVTKQEAFARNYADDAIDVESYVVADDSIKALADDYKQAKAEESEAKKRAEAIAPQIIDYMGGNALLVDDDTNLPIMKVLSKSRTNFDQKRFQLEYPDMYDQFTSVTSWKELHVVKAKKSSNKAKEE